MSHHLRRTTLARLRLEIDGRRPERGASFSIPARPHAANRSLQRPAFCRLMSRQLAMSTFSAPAAASSTIWTRSTKADGGTGAPTHAFQLPSPRLVQLNLNGTSHIRLDAPTAWYVSSLTADYTRTAPVARRRAYARSAGCLAHPMRRRSGPARTSGSSPPLIAVSPVISAADSQALQFRGEAVVENASP